MTLPRRNTAKKPEPDLEAAAPIPEASPAFERWIDLADRLLRTQKTGEGHTRPGGADKSIRPNGEQVLPNQKPVILCIEDQRMYLDLRVAVLRKAGYTVIGVTSTDEALQVLKDAPVCCTIADHMLKGETGTALAKRMKAIKPEVPIVLYSGRVPERLEGVDVYVNKGEPTATFLSIVHAVVQRYCS